MAGTNPLVVCDVAEHAWSVDYQDRSAYIAKFLDHIDWRAGCMALDDAVTSSCC